MRTATALVILSVALSACTSNADKNQDGTVEGREFCQTDHEITCDIHEQCVVDWNMSQYASHEDCMADAENPPGCDYRIEHCEYDEQAARDCVTERSVLLSTCQPGDPLSIPPVCSQAWDCSGVEHD